MQKLIGVVFGIIFIVFAMVANTKAEGSIWTNVSTSNLTTLSTYSNNSLPIELGKILPCKKYSLSDSSNNILNYCVVSAGGYTLTDDAKIVVPSRSKLVQLENKYNTNGSILPLPYSNNIVEVRGKGSTARLVLINNAYNNLSLVNLANNNYKLQITNSSQTLIKDALNNSDLYTDMYRNVSSNGKWLVSQNGNGLYKVNLLTQEVQYIRDEITTKSGLDPLLAISISNDGRYVAIHSAREQRFEVIDTNNCVDSKAKDGLYAKCNYTDYMSKIKKNVNGIYTDLPFKNVNFVGNESIKFFTYADYENNSKYNIKEVVLSVNSSSSTLDYLALGDSYASGEGTFNYKSITDDNLNKCHLSELSYPYQIMKKGLVGTTESVACSGAKTKDVIDLKNIDYTKDDPQSNLYANNYIQLNVIPNFIPGGVRQKDFIDEYNPNIITLSIGGNDIGFSKIISNCVAGASECYETRQSRQQLVKIIENTYPNLVQTYQQLKSVNPNSRLYVIGYPQVAKTDGDCANNVKLTNNEITFTKDLIAYLNSVIKMASNEAGVYYVDAENAFNGRKLCESASSLSAMNGLTAGGDSGTPKPISSLGINGPLGQESYHPSTIGHNMYTKTILEKTANLTSPMPSAVTGKPLEYTAEKKAFLEAVAPGDEYGLNAYYDDSVTADTFTKKDNINVTVDSKGYFIKPNAQASVYMYSTPTKIGDVTTDSNGNVIGDFEVPDNIESGYHTLHIYTKNIFGDDLDIQKIIYVAESEEDIDGDGVLNIDEECLVGEPAGVDYDQDGIDDACDGFIDEPPAKAEEPVTPTVNNQENTPSDSPATVDNQPEQPQENTPISEPNNPTFPEEVIEQPIVVNTTKELPVSESEPLNTQIKTISDPELQTPSPITVTNTNSPSPSASIITYTSPSPEASTMTPQQQNTPNTEPTNTKVAGVSSAIEEKPEANISSRFSLYIYVTIFLALLFTIVAVARLRLAKNRV